MLVLWRRNRGNKIIIIALTWDYVFLNNVQIIIICNHSLTLKIIFDRCVDLMGDNSSYFELSIVRLHI